MSVVLVDWLGRGGIAQTSETWMHELEAAGEDVCVVTRADRELAHLAHRVPKIDVVEATAPRALAAHRAVVDAGVRTVRAMRPASVVIQNYIVPALEAPLHRAAREVGARVVVVMHDDRPHTLRAGTRIGLRRSLRRADVVVAHTAYVGDAVARWTGRPVTRVPHPMQVGMLRRTGGRPAVSTSTQLFGLHFGTLRRRYKGSALVQDLAGHIPGWSLGAIGAGAPPARPGLVSARGWISSADLVATVAVADAVILPYRRATQSGAVVLAQALGVVPVATAVGGVPEQIEPDVDGVLLSPDASPDEWRDALVGLAEDKRRARLGAAARRRAEDAHAEFARAVPALVA